MLSINPQTGFYQGRRIDGKSVDCVPTGIANYLLFCGYTRDVIQGVAERILTHHFFKYSQGKLSKYFCPQVVREAFVPLLDEPEVSFQQYDGLVHLPAIFCGRISYLSAHLFILADGKTVIDNDGLLKPAADFHAKEYMTISGIRPVYGIDNLLKAD